MEKSKQYELLVDLYKYFSDSLLKGIAFIYAIISGLLAFYLTNQDIDGASSIKSMAEFAVAVSAVFSVFLFFLIRNLGVALHQLASELELEFYPSVRPFLGLLIVNFLAMGYAFFELQSF